MRARVLRPEFPSAPSPDSHPTCLSHVEANLAEASAFQRDIRWCPEAANILNRAHTRFIRSLLAALREEFGDLTLHTRKGVGVVRVERKEASHAC